jgi:quinohemoprotein ethanol dehydrogenase
MERAAKTWTGEWWKYGGGGTVWDAIVHDPGLDLLFVGTGNGTPWNRLVRSPGGGDNLYLSSILALRPKTGELVWHYQTTPGDTWDYTATQPIILADLTIGGRPRKVLMQAPKNGFFYVLDRATGELISADLLLPTNWTTGIDMKTGRPVEVPGARYESKAFIVNPGPLGRHNYQPMALSSLTGLVYIPVQQPRAEYRNVERFQYVEGQWNLGVDVRRLEPDSPAALLIAWDPVGRKESWRVEQRDYSNGGVLATGGNLVFHGVADGRFIAYRATDGRKLWESQVGVGIIAAPITYELEGKQYVSVLAGWGGAAGVGGRNLTGNFGTKGRLVTYALDGKAQLPPVKVREYPPLTPVASTASPESVQRGEILYHDYCRRCHGADAASGGPMADLRRSHASTFGQYQMIVLKGALREAGMPSFADVFGAQDVEDIRAFVLSKRAELVALQVRTK